MMLHNIRRSATTLLAISTRRNFILSTSTFASLVIVASPFSTFAATPQSTKRYKTSLSDHNSDSCTESKLTMADITTGYLNAQDAAALDAELMSTPGFSLGELDDVIQFIVTQQRTIMYLHSHKKVNSQNNSWN